MANSFDLRLLWIRIEVGDLGANFDESGIRWLQADSQRVDEASPTDAPALVGTLLKK